MAETTCTASDCEKKRQAGNNPHCSMHATRLRRNGTLEQLRPWHRNAGKTCKIAGCEKSARQQGMCRMHYARVRRHGDAQAVLGGRFRSRDEHWNWQGERIRYRAAHNRLYRELGAARNHDCVDCGEQAQHWSYDHAAEDERYEIQTGLPFSLEPEHYSPRCAKCHSWYDRHGADPRPARATPRPTYPKQCVICGVQSRGRGYCSMHLARIQRHGDPHFTLRQLPRRVTRQ